MPNTVRSLPVCLLFAIGAIAVSTGDQREPNRLSVQRQGPILLPPGPPYLNRAAEDEKPAPAAFPSGGHGTYPPDGRAAEKAPPEQENAEQEAQEEAAQEQTGQDEEAPETTQPEAAAPGEPAAKRQFSPAMAALRDRVRRTLILHYRQLLNTRQNTATELLHVCLAFGCNTQVYQSFPSGGRGTRHPDGRPARKINGITCLCWNYPCAGYKLLGLSEGRVAARIGYGMQERPSQLLAMLALSRVRADYPVRVGEDVRSVADLVEHEKLSCRSGTELSLKLIGLSCYVDQQTTWKNRLGQQWSIERIIKEELEGPVVGAADGGTRRLLGLSYAVYRRAKRKRPIDGQFRRAKKYVDAFHDYAMKLQNQDGSWGPRYFAARGTSRDRATRLRSTGHVLEWLAFSLPEDRLEDAPVVKAVECVNSLLNDRRYRHEVKSLSTREIGSVMHALHALSVYDRRLFKPANQEKPAVKAEEVARKPAA